ncbi:MAG TPA: hypothetical protein VFF04_03650 [Candidatus Babeliales bacterium]|nr:hypothetical protein [Candidatus Babeliales bacterium]
MIILLAPEKLITSTSKEQWDALRDCDITLFTSKSETHIEELNNQLGDVFNRVEYFDDYPNNDTVEVRLLDYARKYKVKNIIPMTEADILRVSRVKEKLMMDGMKYSDAIQFRDKIAMKELATQSNINIPQFRRIKHTIDLLEFIDEVGYPIIIKPILGRGSLNTLLISDQSELIKILNAGLISNTSRYPDLLAEEYLDATIYHIDGVQLNNQIEVMSVSRYVNTCLSFVGGSYLGSYTLDFQNPLRNDLIRFTSHILTKVFPLHKNSLFHVEVFVDKQNKISLCEVACRIGGNGINDEVRLQQGIDIKMEYIKAECGLSSGYIKLNKQNCHPIAGRLLIPPKEAKLISFPAVCDKPGVIKYQVRGKHGRDYKKMQMSNDEIANFLLVSGNENEMCEKITTLSRWFDENVVWE